MKRLAPAKVNLLLEIVGRREDGYHLLQSIMAPLTLADELEFSQVKQGITLSCDNPDLPVGADNLIVRTATALCEETGCRKGIHIRLVKRIPMAAGLGGGSSDAACTLMAIRDMFNLPVSDARMHELAVNLGADVPFFLLGRPCLAEGIGDVLRPYSLPAGLPLALVKPVDGLPTEKVYQALGWPLTQQKKPSNLPPALDNRAAVLNWLRNDLEAPAFTLQPQVKYIKEMLLASGARGALMTGSGPTVFGIFIDSKDAAQACQTAQKQGFWAFPCALA